MENATVERTPVRQLMIHTTDRGTYKTCRQRWDFASPLRRNLEPKRPQQPLWFGTGIHLALETYYEPSTPRDVSLAIAAWDEYAEAERKRYIAENGELWNEEEELFNENEQLGRDMIRGYCIDYAPSRDDFDVVQVEGHFTYPLFELDDGTEIVYSFRLDALVKDRHGRYWIIDHKTASRLEDSREWLAMDEQCGSYIVAIQKTLGIVIEGVIYNTLVKKAPKPLKELKAGGFSMDKRQTTSYKVAKRQLMEAYDNRIPSSYNDFLEYLANQEAEGGGFFYRDYVRRNQKELDKLWDNILHEAREMVDPNLRITRTPTMFNCRLCAFKEPCIALWEDSDYELILNNLYRQKKVR